MLLLREKGLSESMRERDEESEGGGRRDLWYNVLFSPQGGSSPGGSWPGTIKSSRELTAEQWGTARRGQKRAGMSNAE